MLISHLAQIINFGVKGLKPFELLHRKCHVQEFSPDFPPSTMVSGGGANARGVQVTDGKEAVRLYDEERVSR